jgi:anthranilate synthase component 1
MENEIVVGSSPESFVAVHNGEVTTNPIARNTYSMNIIST